MHGMSTAERQWCGQKHHFARSAETQPTSTLLGDNDILFMSKHTIPYRWDRVDGYGDGCGAVWGVVWGLEKG